MIKKLLLFGLVFALGQYWIGVAAPTTAAAADVVKIGVFDLQRAINESKKGQAAKSKLMTKFEKMQKELNDRETEVNKMQADLERQASMLSPEAQYEKDKVLKRKVRDFQDLYRDYQEQMKKDEMESTQPIVEEVLRIANNLGAEQGYTLVLEGQKSGVVYAPEAIDITAEVIKRFDTAK
ncbi:MAG: OmpH family outer membrane protein [Pseudomonadota bacterium]